MLAVCTIAYSSETATALKAEDLKRLKQELVVPCETNGWGQLFTRCQVNGAKCYIFDRYSGKRDYSCDNIGACRYNDSCRATASFLNFLVRKYPGILARANAALRAHAFDNGTFWKEATGKSAAELEELWRSEPTKMVQYAR